MSDNTRRMVRLILAAIVAGINASGGVLLISMTPEGTMKPGAWIIATITGVLGVCASLQASFSQPPSPTP